MPLLQRVLGRKNVAIRRTHLHIVPEVIICERKVVDFDEDGKAHGQ